MAQNELILGNASAEGKGIVFDVSKIKIVSIDDVEVNDWNPKDDDTPEFRTVMNEIKKKGLRAPIYVRRKEVINDIQKYEVVDGEQRLVSCRKLHYQVIPIYDWEDMPLKEAQEMTLGFQVQVPFNETKLADLLKGMIEEYGDNIQVPYTPQQIRDYLKLTDFDWSAYKGEMLHLENSGDKIVLEVDASFLPEIREFIDQNEPSTTGKRKRLTITGVTKIPILADAAKIVTQAIEECMITNDIDDKGRALELVCAEYLSGSVKHELFEAQEGEIVETNNTQTAEEYQH